MTIVMAFLIGGGICALAELIKDLFKLTTGHLTMLLVSLGTVLEFGNFYDKLIDISGCGALLPITSFGHSLSEAAYTRMLEDGFMAIFIGMYDKTSGGISYTIFLAVILAILFNPRR